MQKMDLKPGKKQGIQVKDLFGGPIAEDDDEVDLME